MSNKELRFQEIGDGKPLLILHGLFGSSDNWVGIAKKLSGSYRSILLDLPNHGQSKWSDTFTYSTLAKELHDFLQEKNYLPLPILGHSMGGKVAMQLVHDFPDSFKKMIVVDIAPKLYESSHTPIFDAMTELPINTISSLREAFTFLNEQLNDDALSYFLLKNLSVKEGSVHWKINLTSLIKNYPHILDAPKFATTINTPSLFIRGLQSDYIQDSDKNIIRDTFIASSFIDIDNAGHWVHAQKPDIVVKEIEKFLN
jgi:esterase